MRQDGIAQLVEKFSRKIAVGELARHAGYLFKIISRPFECIDIVRDDPGSAFVQTQCGLQFGRNFQPSLEAWVGMGDWSYQYLRRFPLLFRYGKNDHSGACLGALFMSRVAVRTPEIRIPDHKAGHGNR